MNAQKLANPFVVVPMLAALVAVAIAYRLVSASTGVDDFLRLRSSIYAVLQERATEVPPGVTIILPPTEDRLSKVANPFPDEAHIRSVVRDRNWHGGGGFQLLLELTPSALPTNKQGNSDTMSATVLLNHYFGDLERLGLRRRGSPGVVMSKVQSSRNEWFSEQTNSITVEGYVFVSPESQQAIVICNILERLSN